MREYTRRVEHTASTILLAAAIGLGTSACRSDFITGPPDVAAANPCDGALPSPGFMLSPELPSVPPVEASIVHGPAVSYTTPDACVPLSTYPDGTGITVACRDMGAIVKLYEGAIIDNFWDKVVTADGHVPTQPEWINEAYLNALDPIADCPGNRG